MDKPQATNSFEDRENLPNLAPKVREVLATYSQIFMEPGCWSGMEVVDGMNGHKIIWDTGSRSADHESSTGLNLEFSPKDLLVRDHDSNPSV